ncbi:MAG TPA: aminoglycoside phosphotransferase family protein [Kofleriaceae bacterium]|nr:aminoglycoside phosphotransferase family protein [Kofleriaceae bacterium]
MTADGDSGGRAGPPPAAPPDRSGPEAEAAEAAAAWGWVPGAGGVELLPVSGGLINATWEVRIACHPVAVLQRLHPVFGGAVNLDLEAVTAHLARAGLVTPRLLRTRAGEAWLERPSGGPARAGQVWRALTWVGGVTVHRVPDPSWAEAGGELVGRFHAAVADLDHAYAFARAGVHDTAAHLARLRALVEAGGADPAHLALGREVLAAAGGLPPLPDLPPRHCHGDLKISNLRFEAGPPPRGLCLLDLDTLGRGTLAFELGDAMRSWCNPRGEDAGEVAFDLAIFEAAMRGFLRVAGSRVSPDERRAIVLGLETVCVELAARFAVDVFRDEYFGWDPARFPSRRAHNLVRARGQLALGLAVRAARADALALALAA